MSLETSDTGPAAPEPAPPTPKPATASPSALDTRPWTVRHRRALVNGSRTALLMLFIAAMVMLGLGVVALLRADPAEVDGWLRAIFGAVFGVVALAMAAVLGIPSAIGLWAMAGATREGTVPALGPRVRQVVVAVAVATVVITLVVLVATGSAVAILNLGLAGLVALSTLGLAGAASFSPHRGRAIVSAVAGLLVSAGALWVLVRAFLGGAG